MKEGEARHGIYLAHRAALIDYATPILGSREAAEDIVQDAYLKFAPAEIRARSREQALAYLYRIVRNLAFDVLKRRKVEATREAQPPFWALPCDKPTPEQSMLFCDEVRLVNEVMDELPIHVRVALEMHRFSGYTLEEVAEHLGISVATAHRHVRGAMMRIAQRLDRDDA